MHIQKWLFNFCVNLLATFQVQALELNFVPETFQLSIVCVNAPGVNNTCDVTVMLAEDETKICQFIAIASKGYSCQLPKRSETTFLVLAYDEDYPSEAAVTEMFLTPRVDNTPTESWCYKDAILSVLV